MILKESERVLFHSHADDVELIKEDFLKHIGEWCTDEITWVKQATLMTDKKEKIMHYVGEEEIEVDDDIIMYDEVIDFLKHLKRWEPTDVELLLDEAVVERENERVQYLMGDIKHVYNHEVDSK